MFSLDHQAVPAREAYAAFAGSKQVLHARIVPFFGVEGHDVYNPSVPFELDGVTWMTGRVEARDGHASRTMFFERQEDGYHFRADMPVYELEDPFITFVDGELVLGGVSVVWEGITPVAYKTVFYRGKSLLSLTPFAEGPRNMKDIRLVQLADGRIGVFTRPRDFTKLAEWGSLARIGFTVIGSLAGLCPEAITTAPLLRGQFTGIEWGGINQAILLEDGNIGVVGHRSWGRYTSVDDCDLHYYGTAFMLDPETSAVTPSRVIISRDCFPEAPAKNAGLVDVVFTSGIVRHGDGTATVYTGLSDAAVGSAVIPDPFWHTEEDM